jgi:hypothetical protein
MRGVRTWIAAALAAATVPLGAGASGWEGYLDYAYVYSSADPEALSARLEQYGKEAGGPLERFVARSQGGSDSDELDENAIRRRAIALLLRYLASGDVDALEGSVQTVRQLEKWLGRHENRYWYHYVLAHHALEGGRQHDFVAELLGLWLEVVVPLETPYEQLRTLALSDSPNSGFVSALPYVYENVARLILIRSQEMGIDRGLDPLGAIVRLLQDGRVGAHPDVIPAAASSREYVERIVVRLEGPESDAGSLTFTLALFEAGKYHDRARGRLASEGLAPETIDAIRVTSGAYETALRRAETVQGRCAVHTRALRLLGEVYAAKQRLEVDPEIEMPFSIEDAIEVYGELQRGFDGGFEELGYGATGRPSYLAAMRGLWEEIQEASLNAADHYLALAVAKPGRADEHSRNAARIFARYLAFFHEFAKAEAQEAVPDSAYFAAHEAARGLGDSYLAYAARPTQAEIERATSSYRQALLLFPFDRRLWPALSSALQNQGRESEYMALARPVAEKVTRSRHLDAWVAKGEPGTEQLAPLRNALADTEAIMHLGFAEALGADDLEQGLVELRAWRDRVAAGEAGAGDADAPPAAPADLLERNDRERDEAEARLLLARLAAQIEARSRALPIYRAALSTGGLSDELRGARDHPVHALLRRMYHESY